MIKLFLFITFSTNCLSSWLAYYDERYTMFWIDCIAIFLSMLFILNSNYNPSYFIGVVTILHIIAFILTVYYTKIIISLIRLGIIILGLLILFKI